MSNIIYICKWISFAISIFVISQMSNIAFLRDLAETVDVNFGLIHQNISIKKASIHF